MIAVGDSELRSKQESRENNESVDFYADLKMRASVLFQLWRCTLPGELVGVELQYFSSLLPTQSVGRSLQSRTRCAAGLFLCM